MEIFSLIGIVVVVYILWVIIKGIIISRDVKDVVTNTLLNIHQFNKSKEQVIKELNSNNCEYELNNDGKLFFQVPICKYFAFSYNNLSNEINAHGGFGTKYDGIEITLNRTTGDIISRPYYGNNTDAILFMRKLPFYGVRPMY